MSNRDKIFDKLESLGDSMLLLEICNARVEERTKSIDSRMERIDHSLYGNGQPGIMQRVDKLESLASITLGVFTWFLAPGAVLSGILYFLWR